MDAQARGFQNRAQIAIVEPLPLVPATWITGGSLRSGWPSRASRALHALEAEIDAARMQRRQPRDQFAER
jgi:hypothetical protein